MANTNRFQGLARGPIDHKSSSVINQVSNASIDMGSVVTLESSITSGETLPRVNTQGSSAGAATYGIAVGGDTDGIYGDGAASSDDSTRATNAAGQGIVIVTQGRCLARVLGGTAGTAVIINTPLTQSATSGVLKAAVATEEVIARALNIVANTDVDMIAVDVQREGAVET